MIDKRRVVKELRLRNADCCHYCGNQMQFQECLNGRQPGDKATLEHLVPRCEGGSDEMSNLVLACHRCNQRQDQIRKLSLAQPDFDWHTPGQKLARELFLVSRESRLAKAIQLRDAERIGE